MEPDNIKIKPGTIIKDTKGKTWILGQKLGAGGFGAVYTAKKKGAYHYAVKFSKDKESIMSEVQFYSKIANTASLKKFKQENKLKHLGIPKFCGYGKFRRYSFMVIKRYSYELAKAARGLPIYKGTLYRMAVQILDVLHFLASNRKVHCDIKGENILFSRDEACLIDFGGCVDSFSKEEPSYTSYYATRDVLQKVNSLRSDLEMLIYVLLELSGFDLPWKNKGRRLTKKLKFDFMKPENLKMLRKLSVPGPLLTLFNYVVTLEENSIPDYTFCKYIFKKGLEDENLIQSGAYRLLLKP